MRNLRLTTLSKQLFATNKSVHTIKGNSAFETATKGNKNNILLDFYADWCGPCKVLGPRLEKTMESKTNWTLLKINIDQQENSDLVQKYKVSSVPTLVVLKDGKMVQQRRGNLPDEELQSLLK